MSDWLTDVSVNIVRIALLEVGRSTPSITASSSKHPDSEGHVGGGGGYSHPLLLFSPLGKTS